MFLIQGSKMLFSLPAVTQTTMIFILIYISVILVIQIWYTTNIKNMNSYMDAVLPQFKVLPYNNKQENWKYILLRGMKKQHINQFNGLSNANCSIKNCILTNNENFFFGNITDFDAVIFNEYALSSTERPVHRLDSQLYVFWTVQSPVLFPACDVENDNFFNWTFTSRLDSTVPYPYIVVRNVTGAVIAPSVEPVDWELSEEVPLYIDYMISQKRLTAAWIVNNCNARSPRAEYLQVLQETLHHLAMRIDVYGDCSRKACGFSGNCSEMIKRDYFFYMAFENSFAKDYVSDKVLRAYDNYAVPVVFGGANYSRFLPPGSYIDARTMHPNELAYKLKQATDDWQIYRSYFKWRKLYTISSAFEDKSSNNPLCKFCEALNEDRAKNAPAIAEFRSWWNGEDRMKWCVPDAEAWEVELWAWSKSLGLNNDA